MNKNNYSKLVGDNIVEIEKKGNVTILTASNSKYVLKETKKSKSFYEYLITRGFKYFPDIYSGYSDKYIIMNYIYEKDIPLEQKLEDLVYLISILHLDTLFDKKIDLDYVKEVFEDIRTKQDELYNYYLNLQNLIEEEKYMSPSNYSLIRNISIIYLAINYSKRYLDKFYEIMKDKNSIRYAYIHGNLDVMHLLEGDNLYLISWDKSRIDLPLYDIYDFYRKNYNDISLDNIFSIYEKKLPLKKEEKYLLYSLLFLPGKINSNNNEYIKTKEVSNMIFYFEDLLNYLENNSNKTNNNT